MENKELETQDTVMTPDVYRKTDRKSTRLNTSH